LTKFKNEISPERPNFKEITKHKFQPAAVHQKVKELIPQKSPAKSVHFSDQEKPRKETKIEKANQSNS
jgi:hypothetical protein